MDRQTEGNLEDIQELEVRLKIGQINLGNGKNATDEIISVSSIKDLDIVLIQEPYTMRPFGRMQMIPGMPPECRVITPRSLERFYAAIVVFDRNIDILVLEDLTDEYFVVVECTDRHGKIILITAYFKPSIDIAEMINKLDTIISKVEGKNILIGMDANAKSLIWGDRTCDKGRKMEEFICEKEIIIANDRSELPTYSSTNGESYIDLTLIKGGIGRYIENWKVYDGEVSSDHRLITFDVLYNRNESENISQLDTVGYNIEKANWTRFEERLEELFTEYSLNTWVNSREDLDRRIKALNEVILKAADYAIPTKQLRKGRSRWWNSQLEKERRRVRRSRKRYQNNRRNERERDYHLERYNEMRRAYKQKIRDVKEKSFQSYVERDLSRDPWGGVYKLAAEKLKLETVMTTVRKEGNTNTESMKETLEAIMNGIVEDDTEDEENEWQRRVRADIIHREYRENVEDFNENELTDAIMDIKNKKAPGNDRLKGELIKHSYQTLKREWLQIANDCLKKGYFPKVWKIGLLKAILKAPKNDPKDISSRRPLTMLPEMGKVLERMIKRKIEENVENVFSTNQYGFVKGKGTVECMTRLMNEIDIAEEKYVATIFLDIKGAFNNLWWPAVIRACNLKKFPKNVIDLIESYLSDRKLLYRSKFNEVEKELSKGCPQGSILGPFIWNLVLDEVLEMENNQGISLAYADDICVIVKGETRNELMEKGRLTMERIMDWMSKQKLTLSVEKCAWMLMKGTLVNPPTIAKIYGKPIKKKDSIKYLGVIIDEKRTFTEHVKYVSGKMRTLMMTLRGYVKNKWGKVRDSMRIIYERAVVPICTYGCEIWGHVMSVKYKAKLILSGQRLCAIAIAGVYRSVSLDASLVLAGTLPIDKVIQMRRMRSLVRKGAVMKYKNREFSENTSLRDFVRQMEEMEYERWQIEWNNSSKGRTTYEWIKNIAKWIETWSEWWRRMSKGITEILTGHGEYGYHLHKIGKRQTPLCICGSTDNPVHRIRTCPLYDEEREEILDGNETWPEDPFDIIRKLIETPGLVAKINEWRNMEAVIE